MYLNFLIVPLRAKQGLEKLCHWVIELQQSLSSRPPEWPYTFFWSVNRAMATRLQGQLDTLEACIHIGPLEFLAWNSAHTEYWAQSNKASLTLLFLWSQSTIKALAFLKHDLIPRWLVWPCVVIIIWSDHLRSLGIMVQGDFLSIIPVFLNKYGYLTFQFRPSYQHYCLQALEFCILFCPFLWLCYSLSLENVKESNEPFIVCFTDDWKL